MNASAHLLRLHVPPDGLSERPQVWCILDTRGRVQARGEAPLRQAPHSAELELILPAHLVAQHQLDCPVGSGKHEEAIIRQQLEDRVLGKLADTHVVRGERQGNTLTIWLASRSALLALIQQCQAAGRQITRILPEQALLAPQSFARTARGLVYRSSTGACGVLPEEALLEPLYGEAFTQIDALLAQPCSLPLNLMAGLPNPNARADVAWQPLLKIAAGLVLALAVAHLLSLFVSWRQLSAQNSGLRTSIRQNFAAAHPGVPIVDPILQWRQLHSSQASTASDAFDHLTQWVASLGMELRPKRIDVDANTLRLSLTSSDASQLKSALQEKKQRFDSSTTDQGLEQISINFSADKAQP